MKASRTWLAVFVLLSIPGRFFAQAPPLDPEFQVNTYTTGIQYSARVAVNREGNFVVVWQGFGQDGAGFGIFGQRFSSLGAALGSEFQINTYTTGFQQLPSVAIDDGGNFVVAWQSYAQEGIPCQRFDSSGAKIGSEFLADTYTAGRQFHTQVAGNGDGSFVVVWGDEGLDGSGYGVFGQRFNGSGAKVGSQFQVNTYTTGKQEYPQVAVDRAGNFVVVWDSSGQDGDGYGIVGQRFNGSGAKAGPEFRVNTYTSGSQRRPQVAVDRTGDFVVVWDSSGQDGDGDGVFGQRFNASGERVGSEFPVNTYTTHDQSFPSVAVGEKGDFVVVWNSIGQEGVFLNNGIFGQRFDRSGAAVGGEFPVNTHTTDTQQFPDVAADAAGNVVVAWESGSQDGSIFGVFARRSNLSPALMGVDLHDAAGSISDTDGVLEPGETVSVEPSWKILMTNAIIQPIALSGTASNVSGPVSGTVDDGAADYGLTLSGATASCYDGTLNHDCYVIHAGVPMSRPATHMDLTFDEALSTGGSKAWKLHLGDSFTDVPRSQPFYKKIEALLHNGITTGCDATQYCPGLTVSRGQMGIFVAKGIAGAGELVPTAGLLNGQPYNCSPGGVSRFTDVSPTDSFCRHVHYLGAQNVTLGCSTSQYCPNQTITRDAMASFIAKALVAPLGGSVVPNVYTAPGTGRSYSCNPGAPNLHFADVPVSNAFCRHIHYLWARGIVDGCTTTLYCPANPVNRDAMAKFLANGFGLLLYGP